MNKYVTVEKLSEITGLSRHAIWAMKKKGKLRPGVHFVKHGRRMFINLENFNRCLEGSQV